MFLAQLLDIFFPPRESERFVRTISLHELVQIAEPCTIGGEGLAVTSLLPYSAAPAQACITEAKFHNNKRAQELLGQLLAYYLRDVCAQDEAFILVPIPLSTKRHSERGYNQAEEICKQTVQHFKKILSDRHIVLSSEALRRTRDTLPQTTLGAFERRENLKDAFEADGLDPDYTYIVVDDVLTTGATISSAAAALYKGGARTILPITLAHADKVEKKPQKL